MVTPMSHILPQEGGEHGDGGDTDGHVDPEDDAPAHVLHQKGAERGANHRGNTEYRGDQALYAATFGGRVDIAQDR